MGSLKKNTEDAVGALDVMLGRMEQAVSLAKSFNTEVERGLTIGSGGGGGGGSTLGSEGGSRTISSGGGGPGGSSLGRVAGERPLPHLGPEAAKLIPRIDQLEARLIPRLDELGRILQTTNATLLRAGL